MVDGRYTYTRQLKFLKGVPELDGWCCAHIMGGLNFLAPDKAERAEWVRITSVEAIQVSPLLSMICIRNMWCLSCGYYEMSTAGSISFCFNKES